MRPENIPDPFWDLIQACWKQNPEDRPTFDQITSELRNDKYALDEFGVKTDLDELHEYQDRVDAFQPTQENFNYLMDKLIKK